MGKYIHLMKVCRAIGMAFIVILMILTGVPAGSWTYEFPVAGGGVSGLWPSAAVNSQGNVCVAYVGHSRLMYGVRSSSWNLETVNEAGARLGEAAQYCTLVMYGNVPHIGFYDAKSRVLRYAWKSGGVWVFETADSVPGTGKHACIAVSGNGEPAIAYYDAVSNCLKYARRFGGVWGTEVVATNCGTDSAIAFDASNIPHIVFVGANGRLIHAWKTTVWNTEVAGGTDKPAMVSMAIAPGGTIHVSYREIASGVLRHAWKSGTTWQQENADGTPKTGYESSIAIGPDGYPRIFHFRREGYVTGWGDNREWWSLQARYSIKGTSGWTVQEIC